MPEVLWDGIVQIGEAESLYCRALASTQHLGGLLSALTGFLKTEAPGLLGDDDHIAPDLFLSEPVNELRLSLDLQNNNVNNFDY